MMRRFGFVFAFVLMTSTCFAVGPMSSVIRHVKAIDPATGEGKIGLVPASITAKYLVSGSTLVTLSTEAITTLGTYQSPSSATAIRIKELNNTTPTKGIYEVHFHDNQVSGVNVRLMLFLAATGARFEPFQLDLAPAVILANNATHGGSRAMVNLQKLNVVNDQGDACVFWSTSSNHCGLVCQGNGDGAIIASTGTGQGLVCMGGTSTMVNGGFGILALGRGSSNSCGILSQSTSGAPGWLSISNTNVGAKFMGGTDQPGLSVVGNGTAYGAVFTQGILNSGTFRTTTLVVDSDSSVGGNVTVTGTTTLTGGLNVAP